jgi:hypothetical protein
MATPTRMHYAHTFTRAETHHVCTQICPPRMACGGVNLTITKKVPILLCTGQIGFRRCGCRLPRMRVSNILVRMPKYDVCMYSRCDRPRAVSCVCGWLTRILRSHAHTNKHVHAVCVCVYIYIYIYIYTSSWEISVRVCTRYSMYGADIIIHLQESYADDACVSIYLCTYVHTYIHTHVHIYVRT